MRASRTSGVEKNPPRELERSKNGSDIYEKEKTHIDIHIYRYTHIHVYVHIHLVLLVDPITLPKGTFEGSTRGPSVSSACSCSAWAAGPGGGEWRLSAKPSDIWRRTTRREKAFQEAFMLISCIYNIILTQHGFKYEFK